MSVARHVNGIPDVLSNTTGYLSGSSLFTVMTWVKLDATGPAQNAYILESNTSGNQWAVIYGFVGNNYEFFGGPAFTGTDPRTGSQISVTDTNWHHIAYRYDGTIWCKFLDGTKTVINASITFALSGGNVQFQVGDSEILNNGLIGSVDEIYIYGAALSDGQISAAANCRDPGSIPLGHWPITGASPEPDTSGNGHDLTVSGPTVVSGRCDPITLVAGDDSQQLVVIQQADNVVSIW